MSLFTDRPQASQGPSSFVASIVVHGLVVVLFLYGLAHSPQVSDPAFNKRYAVRRVELNAKEPAIASSGGAYSKHLGARARAARLEIQRDLPSKPSPSRRFPKRTRGRQTLVLPDLPPNLQLQKEIPTPTLLIWTPELVNTKVIVPPQPQKASAADVEPSLDLPNQELDLADFSIASVDVQVPMPVLTPSTTSPVKIPSADPLKLSPTMTSSSSSQPTAAAAISLSDLQMPQGTITLPPLNETAQNDAPSATSPGLLVESSSSSADDRRIESSETATANIKSEPHPPTADAPGGVPQGAAAMGTAPGAGAGDGPTTTLITLPKTGQFGVVVVGSSLDEQFPELLQIWGGRIAYTVYLQVGKSKNWVLQYCLPRDEEMAATVGSASPLEAPWAYSIVRPHLIPALLNAEAMLLHGLVNSAGRFESLEIVYPPRVPQGTLILNSLAQWQFRPARLNGTPIAVEVVLVIPNEPD